MKISIICYSSKELANEEFPIMIRLYDKKYKYIATGVSCKMKNWNEGLNKVASKDIDYKAKNEIIEIKYEQIKQRIKECFDVYNCYDLDLIASNNPILKNEEIKEEVITNFLDVLESKILDYTRYGSIKNIKQLKNVLLKLYGDNILIADINQNWFNLFIKKISDKPVAQQKKLLERFFICYNFGLENGIIKNYIKLKYNAKDFKTNKEKKALSITEFSYIKIVRGTQYELYKLGVDLKQYNIYDYTYSRTDLLNALTTYLIMFALQGLAPVDLADLKISDLKIKTINSEELNIEEALKNKESFKEKFEKNKVMKYFSILDNRKKTGRNINIKVPYDILYPLIKNYQFKKDGTPKSNNDYLLNIYSIEKEYTEQQKEARRTNYFTKMNEAIKKYLKENKQEFYDGFSFYSARHTYLTIGNKMNIGQNVLAQLAAHDEKSLQNYLSNFDDITILDANEKIWSMTK